MSFIGKQFKKAKAENTVEFLGKLNLSESIVALLRNPSSLSTFTKNADGTLQYQVKNMEGKVLLDQKINLDSEVDYKAPDGMATKVKFELDGDLLKSYMRFPDGRVVHMDRHFDANGMKLVLYIPGSDDKATVYYDLA